MLQLVEGRRSTPVEGPRDGRLEHREDPGTQDRCAETWSWQPSSALRRLSGGPAACGVAFEVRQPLGRDVAEELSAVVAGTAAELLVVGIRHRSASC